MNQMNLMPHDVAADEISYQQPVDWVDIIHMIGEARAGRYDLYVMFDHGYRKYVITLANFGKAMTLDHESPKVGWDYIADKLDLRRVDAQIVTHMIHKAFDSLPERKFW
jgi:hypothetical protein